MKMYYIFILPSLFLCSCLYGIEKKQSGPVKTSTETIITKDDKLFYYPEFKNAHPKAKELMNEDFFFSSIDETAPFGNDDGADTYLDFVEWRSQNKIENPNSFLKHHLNYWGYPSFDLAITNYDSLEFFVKKSSMHSRYLVGTNQSIISIGFGQLYLEGEIDKNFLEITINAVERELDGKMLLTWPKLYIEERKQKRIKMKKLLNNLG